MNIDTSSYAALSGSSQSTRTSVPAGAVDPDGDDDGGRVHQGHGHHGHGDGQGGGRMQGALMQALQALGLSLPQSGAGQSAADGADASSDRVSSVSSDRVRHDMHRFMHTLFQALRGENTAADTTTTGKPDLGAAMTALISQASSGTAPTDLQQAFSALMNDMQGSAAGAAGGSAPTLQALLTQMQQDLGYGKSAAATTGNVLSTQA